MPNYTLTYNSDSSSLNDNTGGGWPSFYSFFPDFMIGMNSFFYSFKQGNLYRHNTSAQRNTYYGIFEASTITSVFNPEPTISIKLFKTLSYESNTTVADTNEARWECTSLLTDLLMVIQDQCWVLILKKKKESGFLLLEQMLIQLTGKCVPLMG